MAQNLILGNKFYYTARAGEQLYTNEEKELKNKFNSNIEEYISTVSQNSLTSKEQNEAIRYNARAGFTLYQSNTLKTFNSYIKKANLNNNVA